LRAMLAVIGITSGAMGITKTDLSFRLAAFSYCLPDHISQ